MLARQRFHPQTIQARSDDVIKPGRLANQVATLTLLKVVHEPPDKRVSFVDCLVMATATFYGTREIFGFDAVFERNGFHLPGKAEQQAA